ncbi:MAG: ParB/RepB/Spo0J family partition protein [Peptococcaceae bacterium]|nr:ParB/RepB/Spo0J family partition protein [Peptococcaceae bacterium]
MAKVQTKGGLGPGIEKLFNLNEPVSAGEAAAPAEIRIDQISSNAYQPRREFDENKLTELMESIREHGVVQPVVVRAKEGGAYELVAGERRVRACRRLGYERVPAIVRDFTDGQMMEVALIENLQREDLNPVEEALAYQRLAREFGLTQEQIAQKVSKSRSLVANMMRLLNLPQEVLDALAKDEMTVGHARPLLSLAPEQAVLLAGRVKVEGLSVREVEERVKDLTVEKKPNKSIKKEAEKTLDPNLKDLEGQLRSACGTKVEIIEAAHGKGGRIMIEFYSADDLDRIAGYFLPLAR